MLTFKDREQVRAMAAQIEAAIVGKGSNTPDDASHNADWKADY
jgi:hypothetical protein